MYLYLIVKQFDIGYRESIIGYTIDNKQKMWTKDKIEI